MNDSRITVFGQSMERGSDELYTHICCLCDKVRLYKEARSYCGHCDTLFCKDCMNNERENHRGHKIVAVSDWGEKIDDRCPSCRRDGCKISRRCSNHDVDIYCCYQCTKDKHSECETVTALEGLAKGVYASEDFETVNVEVVIKTIDTEKLTSNKKDDRKVLKNSKQTSVGRLKQLRKKVNDIFDKLEEDATDEMNEKYDKDFNKLDSEIEECEEVLANLRCLKMYMESKTASEPQMFLKLEQIRDKLMDFDMQLIKRESSPPKFKEYEFIEDPTVLNFIESIDTLKLKKQVEDPEPMLPENQQSPPETERVNMMNEASSRNFDTQSRIGTASLAVAESLTRTNSNITSSKKTTSGLEQTTTFTALDAQSKSQHVDVLKDAYSSSQPETRSENNSPTVNAKKDAPEPNYNNTPRENQLTTTLNIDSRPELKISMDVKIDTRVPYNQNESPNVAKMELHEEKAMDISSSAASEVSVRYAPKKVEHKEVRQEYVEPKSPRRTTATPTISRAASILPRKVSEVSELHIQRSPRFCGLPQRINIRLAGDNHTCNIQGMFGLKNGNILLSDTKNKKLKLIDKNYKVIASCEMTAEPRGVSEAGEHQAVAALNNKTIQYVSMIGNTALRASRCITLGHDCYGISHCNGKLYITELNGKCVHVYDTNGNSLSNISENNMAGLPRFVRTQHVYVTRDGTRIYVADAMKGLVTVSPKGATLATITQPGLLSACGVCTDTSGNVYVSGMLSHNVMKFEDRGTRMQRVVATPESGVSYPKTLWFNSSKSELIVSNNPNPFGDDFVNVYKVTM